jgi:ABC-type transport system substrate-binding protein
MKTRRLVWSSLLVIVVLWTSLGWAQQPKPGGTLRLAMPGDMTFFNANQGPAPGYFTFWVWNNLFNSLLTMTPPPEWKVSPELATSWDVQELTITHNFRALREQPKGQVGDNKKGAADNTL